MADAGPPPLLPLHTATLSMHCIHHLIATGNCVFLLGSRILVCVSLPYNTIKTNKEYPPFYWANAVGTRRFVMWRFFKDSAESWQRNILQLLAPDAVSVRTCSQLPPRWWAGWSAKLPWRTTFKSFQYRQVVCCSSLATRCNVSVYETTAHFISMKGPEMQ